MKKKLSASVNRDDNKTLELFARVLVSICSIIFVLPALIAPGIWKTFDSPFHISMIAQFHQALKYLYIPVVWTDGVANYGLPFGIIAHPLTSYLGGLITFLTNDPLISYKILWLIFSFITSWGMYRLLRRFAGIWPSFAGTVLYTFTAYHILNLYIRGALPEFAAASWLPFLLYTLFTEKEKTDIRRSFVILVFWYTLIFFTHPMYLLFSSFLTGLFLIYYRPVKKFWFIVFSAGFVAILINAFYLLPLNLEMKYFYMGGVSNFLAKGSGLNISNFFIEQWEFTCSNGDTIAMRCNRIQTGLPETIILLLTPLLYFLTKDRSKKKKLLFVMFVGLSTTLFLSPVLEPLYQRFKLLGSIQFLFRFLNIWVLLSPIILAIGLDSLKRYKNIAIGLCITVILFLRLPQLYVKNVTNPNRSIYYFNVENIHSVMMNTVWMGEPKTYKREPKKSAIISGKGKIFSTEITPTKHLYLVKNNEDTTFADYTFYFPGWHAFVDNVEAPIQWQDPNHRGYITFPVPKGNHMIAVIFKDTMIRFIGKIISLIAITVYLFCIALIVKRTKPFQKYH